MVMLNWPRVTCSSSSSMLAPCSNKKLVIRATTPVLSRPRKVIVASCRTGKEQQKRVGAKREKRPGGLGLCYQKQIFRHTRRTTGASRQARWCFDRCFPLTPALSLGERENLPRCLRQSRASRLVAARGPVFPLPAGEGRGEGERDAANQNGRTNFASSFRPAPRAGLRPQVLPSYSRDGRGRPTRAFWRDR